MVSFAIVWITVPGIKYRFVKKTNICTSMHIILLSYAYFMPMLVTI